MTGSLREATPADVPAIADIHVRCWEETYRGLIPDRLIDAMTPQVRGRFWTRTLSEPPQGTIVLIAEEGGVPAGFGSAGPQRDGALAAAYPGEIYALYVRAAYQGRGIGRALFDALATRLARDGHRALALWVLDTNLPARRFYERCGLEAVGSRVDASDPATPLTEIAYAHAIAGDLPRGGRAGT